MNKCKLCNPNKKVKIYFENEEILISDTDKPGRIVAMIKEHKKEIEDHNTSGIIKLILAILSRHYPNNNYLIETKEEWDHWHIYAKIV